MRRYLLIFIVTLLVAFAGGVMVVAWPGSYAHDYGVFWRAVRSDTPYLIQYPPFAYPPTALLWMSPLKLVPFWVGYVLWTVAGLAAFFLAAARLWGRKAALLALLAPAMFLGLVPGQVSLFASAALFMAFSSRWRGVWLAVALTLKPQLAFLAPVFLLADRDWRAFAHMAATGLTLCLVATVVFGPGIWLDWLTAVPGFQQIVAEQGISPFAISPATVWSLPPAVTLIAGGSMAILSARFATSDQARAALAVFCSLVAAPYALMYDLIAVAPMTAAILLSGGVVSFILACASFAIAGGPLSLLAGAGAVLLHNRRSDRPLQRPLIVGVGRRVGFADRPR